MQEECSDKKILKDSLTHPESFGFLYEKYHDRIYTHLYRLTQNVQVTEDLTEETFLKVLEKRHVILKSNIPFDKYIYRMSTNIAMGYFRKEKSKRRFSENLKVKHKIENSVVHSDENEEEIILKNAINSLPEMERVCVIMYYFEHRKMDEIAEILNKGKSTVSVILKKARETIRTKLDENRSIYRRTK